VSLDGIGGDVGPCQDVGMTTSGPVIAQQQGIGGRPMAALVQSGTATTGGGLRLAIMVLLAHVLPYRD